MEADPLAPALFAIKFGLYGSALLAAGIGLHASLNIIAREDRPHAMRTAAVASLFALAFAALRLLFARRLTRHVRWNLMNYVEVQS